MIFQLVTSPGKHQRAFILTDLSLERPSCYYELGLAEALDKPVYLIAVKGTDIHQTASRRFVRFYNDNIKFENLVLEILKGAVGAIKSSTQPGALVDAENFVGADATNHVAAPPSLLLAE